MNKSTVLTWIVGVGLSAIASGCNHLIPPIQIGLDSCFFLPNGYTYQTVNGHYIYKGGWNAEGQQVAAFGFGNRIYVNARYVVGEVRPTSVRFDDPELESKYKYFILDTKANTYVGDLSQIEWNKQLRKLDIAHEVELKPRSEWRHKMWQKYGRGKQC